MLFRSFTGQIVAATISDDEGRFSVDDLPQGHYSLNAQMLGFAPHNQVISLGPSTDLGQINLSPSEEQLQEVTVTARAQPTELSNYSVSLRHGKNR